jgi:hypothetical protein
LRTDQQRQPDVFHWIRKRRTDGCKYAKCRGAEHGFQHDFRWAGRNQCQPVSDDYAAIEHFDDEHNHDDHHVAGLDDSEHHDSGHQHSEQQQPGH